MNAESGEVDPSRESRKLIEVKRRRWRTKRKRLRIGQEEEDQEEGESEGGMRRLCRSRRRIRRTTTNWWSRRKKRWCMTKRTRRKCNKLDVKIRSKEKDGKKGNATDGDKSLMMTEDERSAGD